MAKTNMVAKTEVQMYQVALDNRPLSLKEMTREEFDAKMAWGWLKQKARERIPADEFFAFLREEILQTGLKGLS